jgi:hypothetical protein
MWKTENIVNHMSCNSKMQKEKSPKYIGYGSTTVTYHHRMNANHLKKRKSKTRKQKQSILIHLTSRATTHMAESKLFPSTIARLCACTHVCVCMCAHACVLRVCVCVRACAFCVCVMKSSKQNKLILVNYQPCFAIFILTKTNPYR